MRNAGNGATDNRRFVRNDELENRIHFFVCVCIENAVKIDSEETKIETLSN